MSKIVHVSWLNPNQNLDLYPAVLEGFELQDRLLRPTGEYLFVSTLEEAQELKTRIDKQVPKKSYTVLDEDNRPIGNLVSEPEITILNIP